MPPKSKSDAQYRCTACTSKIKSSFDACLHPLLKVLVCRKCHSTYGTGDFSVFEEGVDQNGDDNYCRWCVDGGELYFCGKSDKSEQNKCHYAYCTDCIKRNCPDDDVLTSDNFPESWRWTCFACDSNKLKKLRQDAQNTILALSQRDLKRNNSASSNLNNSTTTADKAPAATTNSDRRKSGEISNRNASTAASSDEGIASMAKKRKIDTGSASHDAPESSSKDSSKEAPSRESAKESAKDSGKEPVKEPVKEAAKEPAKEPAKECVKASVKETARETAKESSKEIPREPEACSMPPLEIPKQAKTSLRQLHTPGSSLSKSSNTSLSGDSRTQRSARDRTSSSRAPSSSASSNLPSSIKSVDAQARPKQSTAILVANDDNTTKVQPKTAPFPSLCKSRPVSKQLKSNNEQILPTTKVQLSESDLKKRLEAFGHRKELCVKEIDVKFQNILQMFTAEELDNKLILKSEIEDLEKPLQEFNTMLINLKSLYHSQN